MLNVQQLHPYDALTIAILHQHCFPDNPWSPLFFQDKLASTCVAYGVFQNDMLVSFILAQEIHTEGEILTLCTHQEHREKSIAKKVLQAFLERPSLQSCFLEVREDNAAAIALYEGCDFIKKDVRKAYYTAEAGSRAGGSTDAFIYAYSKNRNNFKKNT